MRWKIIMSGDYVTPESGTFFTHEQGRSLTEAGLDIACFLFVCFLFCSYFAETVRQTWGQAGRGSVVCISTNHSEYLGDLSVKGEHFERTSPHCATSHDVWWRPKKECLFFPFVMRCLWTWWQSCSQSAMWPASARRRTATSSNTASLPWRTSFWRTGCFCNFVAINNVFFLTLSCFFHASHFSSKSFLMKQI